jgi:hypothetical protein
MKLNELLTEDQDLQEGPLLNKIGAGIGKAAGGAAKAVGAVAGGIAGLGAAAKKGFQAGKTTVAGAGDEPDASTTPAAPGTAAAPTNTAAPAAATTPAASTTSKPAKSNTSFGRLAQAAAGQDPDAKEPPAAEKPAAAEPAAAEKPAAAEPAAAEPAAGTTPPAAEKPVPTAGTTPPTAPAATEKPAPAANDTAYAQAQKSISGLAPEQQKELLAALVADPKVKAALDAAAKKVGTPPATPATATPAPATPAAAPTTPTTATTSAEPAATPKKGSRKKPAALSQAEIDADRDRIMGVTSDSVIRNGQVIAESEISHTEKLAAMNRGFQKGLSNPFASPSANDTADSPAAVDTDIKDPSGTISVELINRVNTLDSTQRGQLFKFLKARKQ